MNIVLDASNSNVSRQQVQQEASVLRERNESLQSQLEAAFSERQTKEAENLELEKEIESERNKLNEMIAAMSEADQQKYHEMEQMVQRLDAQNSKLHEQIDTLMNQKTNMETVTRSSTERMEAVRLLTKLNELQTKMQNVKEEEKNRLSPAQEREKLISEVRESKQALTSIQHQIKIAEDQLTEKRELLQQIEDDLEEGGSERHVKYKELKRRDETMSQFMATFKVKVEEEKESKVSVVVFQIENPIQYIFSL